MDNNSSPQDPAPLFDNVDITTPDEDNEIFESAVQVNFDMRFFFTFSHSYWIFFKYLILFPFIIIIK